MDCNCINVNITNMVGSANGYYTMVDSKGHYVFNNIDGSLLNGMTFSVESGESQFSITSYPVDATNGPCTDIVQSGNFILTETLNIIITENGNQLVL